LDDLLRFAASSQLLPEERSALDHARFKATVSFAKADVNGETTILDDAVAGKVRIRCANPTAFRGIYAADAPLQLEFRLLGVSEDDRGPFLLAEPIGVSR
jgi:hypothetical protein